MSEAEAIEVLNRMRGHSEFWANNASDADVVRRARKEEVEAIDVAMSALRAREQNEPLTYDELITMSGQHVFFKHGKYTNWILLDYDNGVLNYYMFIHSGTITRDTVKNSDTYRFYRYEPKGADQ